MSLEELEAATSSQPLVVFDMEEKLLDKNPTCVNKSKRSLGRLWSRLYVSKSEHIDDPIYCRLRGEQKRPLFSIEGEKLQAELLVRFHYNN